MSLILKEYLRNSRNINGYYKIGSKLGILWGFSSLVNIYIRSLSSENH